MEKGGKVLKCWFKHDFTIFSIAKQPCANRIYTAVMPSMVCI